MAINNEEFDVFKIFLRDEIGFSLTEDKTYLINSRLAPVIRKMGLDNLHDLSKKITAGDNRAKHLVIEAMTPKETYFFRNHNLFETIRTVLLPHIVGHIKPRSKINIWCVGCSSGQEPYSLAIMSQEYSKDFGKHKFNILGTDLSEEILDAASIGKYSQYEVQRGMPANLLLKYFEQQGEDWQLNKKIRKKVKYKLFNILRLTKKIPVQDIIFCRNVIQDFDIDTKRKIYDDLYNRCAKHGFLILGQSEKIENETNKFKPMPNTSGVYIPIDSVYN